MVRARTYFRSPACSPALVYDVIHDHAYRTSWDENMLEGHMLREMDHHNAIGYYAAKARPYRRAALHSRARCPRRSRTAILSTTERGWCAEMRARPRGSCATVACIIRGALRSPALSGARCRPPAPASLTSGWSHCTGYLLRQLPEGGTELTYCTLADPKGWIPAWVMNSAVSVLGPRMVGKLAEAIPNYPAWCAQHRPDGRKPWLTPPGSPRQDNDGNGDAAD